VEIGQRSGLVQSSQFNLAALGFLELSLDNPKETNAILWPLAEGVLAAGIREPGVLRFIPDEIEALIAIAGATRHGRSWSRSRRALSSSAVRGHSRDLGTRPGPAARLARRAPEALAAFGRALEHHSRLEEPFELGRTLPRRVKTLAG
jgi:hypothetical protein